MNELDCRGRRTIGRSSAGVFAGAVLGLLACNPSAQDAANRMDARSPVRAATPDSLLITAKRVGGFALGMTLEQARRTHPTATFARVSDGDGAALVEATLGSGEVLILFADEDDPEATIDWSRPIGTIEVFCPAFRTADGIHPGSRVVDVERSWGEVREIVRSEIESREFIQFARQPEGLTMRLDYTGRFPADSSITIEFGPEATIYSIAISGYGPN